MGELVTVEDAGTPITGRLHGIAEDGALLLDIGGSLRRIVAGDRVAVPSPLSTVCLSTHEYCGKIARG